MHARRLIPAVVFATFVSLPLGAQRPAEMDAINKIIDRYGALDEVGDMAGQAKLMTADRVWISEGAGRRTDQAANMRIQQAQMDATEKLLPGAKTLIEDRDRLIKFYGDGTVAVASFYRYTTDILPPNTPPDMLKSYQPTLPATITLVLEKKAGEWKIVHTHFSALYAAPVK